MAMSHEGYVGYEPQGFGYEPQAAAAAAVGAAVADVALCVEHSRIES